MSAQHREAAKKGGERLRELRGPDYFRALGRRGGNATKAKGALYRVLGTRGGNALAEIHGSSHMAEIGRRGGMAAHRKESE